MRKVMDFLEFADADLGVSPRRRKLGVPQSNITFWERSEKPPRGEVLPELAAALNVSADALLRLTPPKPKKQAAKGRLQSVFESAAKLPRRQQEKIAEFVSSSRRSLPNTTTAGSDLQPWPPDVAERPPGHTLRGQGGRRVWRPG
jgi:transcriptional regulator with XRE-family HTH domain